MLAKSVFLILLLLYAYLPGLIAGLLAFGLSPWSNSTNTRVSWLLVTISVVAYGYLASTGPPALEVLFPPLLGSVASIPVAKIIIERRQSQKHGDSHT